MVDLRTWIAKRVSWKPWRRTHSVNVNGEGFVSEEIAAALFAERQRLVAKLLKERTRRKAAEHKLYERGLTIAESNVLIRQWRDKAIAHGYTDEYVKRDRAAAGVAIPRGPIPGERPVCHYTGKRCQYEGAACTCLLPGFQGTPPTWASDSLRAELDKCDGLSADEKNHLLRVACVGPVSPRGVRVPDGGQR